MKNECCLCTSQFISFWTFSTVTGPKSSNSWRHRIWADKINLHSPAQQLPQSSTGHFIPPFLPAKGKITRVPHKRRVLLQWLLENRFFKQFWKSNCPLTKFYQGTEFWLLSFLNQHIRKMQKNILFLILITY